MNRWQSIGIASGLALITLALWLLDHKLALAFGGLVLFIGSVLAWKIEP